MHLVKGCVLILFFFNSFMRTFEFANQLAKEEVAGSFTSVQYFVFVCHYLPMFRCIFLTVPLVGQYSANVAFLACTHLYIQLLSNINEGNIEYFVGQMYNMFCFSLINPFFISQFFSCENMISILPSESLSATWFLLSETAGFYTTFRSHKCLSIAYERFPY